MSNALAIAAVTAALKDLIGAGLLGLDLSSIGSVNVSARPPDRIATGQTEPNQLRIRVGAITRCHRATVSAHASPIHRSR